MDNNKHLLLVEDEAIIAEAQKRLLSREGFSVTWVPTGERAIDEVRSHSGKIDLVLMDVDLGDGMDGPAAALVILQMADIPVVFLSSHSEKAVVERTERITSYGYVIKNSGLSVLLASIRMAFKLHDAYRDLGVRKTELEAANEGLSSALRELETVNERLRRGNEELVRSENELIKSETALRESEARFRSIISESLEGLVLVDEAGKVFVWNRAIEGITGYPAAEALGRSIVEIQYRLIAEEERTEAIVSRAERELGQGLETGRAPWAGSLVRGGFRRADGTYITVETRFSTVPTAKGFMIVITSRDVTSREKAEDELRVSRAQFKSILDNSPLVISIKDLGGTVLVANRGFGELDAPPPEQMIGRNVRELFPPEVAQKFLEDDRRALDSRDPIEFEEEVRHQDGTMHTYLTVKYPVRYLDNAEPFGICQVSTNITDRKKIESRVKESNILMHAILESSPDVIFFALDREYRYLAFNDKHREVIRTIWGKDIEIGTNMLDVIGAHEDRFKAKENFDRALIGESFVLIEEYGDQRLSRQYWQDYWAPIRSPEGSIIGLTCIVLNVNERMRVEEALRESETKYRVFFETANDAILVIDRESMRILDVNPAASALYGYDREEFKCLLLTDISAEPEKTAAVIRENAPRVPMRMHRKKDGTEFPVEAAISNFPVGESRISVGFIRDITVRAQAEAALEKSLKDKEILLKEMQHRVKNNLNVVAGLLNLEMDNLKDADARQVFNDAQTRIHSIASVYEFLYRSADLETVALRPYIENLVDSLRGTYFTDEGRIRIVADVPGVKLDSKRVVPIGLILNELVSNAIKYAYPSPREGEIRIDLSETETSYSLRVSDDGIGLPFGFDPEESDSLGLKLVRLLAEQLGGEFVIENVGDGGTTAFVAFPK